MQHANTGSIFGALAIVLIGHTADAETIRPGKGSSGDRFDSDRCPQGQVVVGVAGKVGGWINGAQIVCAPMQPNNTTGRSTYRGPVRGADSGAPAAGSCRLGGKVSSAQIQYMNTDYRMVRMIRLLCDNGAPAEISGGQDIDDPGSEPSDFLACQGGESLIGLNINSGRHVNNIGIVCENIEAAGEVAPPPPPKREIKVQGRATGSTAPRDPNRVGQFDLPFETQSSLGGKFDVKLQVVGTYRNPLRFHVTGTLTNTDIGSQYNGTFDGTFTPDDTRTVSLTYDQPAANARGTVVFRFSEDGETVTGQGLHMGHTPFQWNGRRKRGPN